MGRRPAARPSRRNPPPSPTGEKPIDFQSALQDEIDTLRSQYRSERDPAGLVFASLADAYRRAGELDEAWSLLAEGLDEHPDFTTGHLVAARVLRDRGDPGGAAERYGRVLDLDPENTSALRENAALAQDEGRVEEALSLCQRLALLEPTDADLRARIRTLKEAHFRATAGESAEVEEVEEVEEVGLEAESADDVGMEDAWAVEDPWADEEAGVGAGEEAVGPDHEVEAGEGGEEPAVFTRTMADLYARQGHVERALRIYRRLLDRDPDNSRLRSRVQELEGEETGATGDGHTISAYFDSLIGWESRT